MKKTELSCSGEYRAIILLLLQQVVCVCVCLSDNWSVDVIFSVGGGTEVQ